MQGDAQTRYYELAHSVQEDIVRPPLYLRPPAGASLREYQMVGLKWMVSLYNNHLNGILADEMGLGKTVQVMALIAYLMEHKKVFGPHLIIVPNAVMVNWKVGAAAVAAPVSGRRATPPPPPPPPHPTPPPPHPTPPHPTPPHPTPPHPTPTPPHPTPPHPTPPHPTPPHPTPPHPTPPHPTPPHPTPPHPPHPTPTPPPPHPTPPHPTPPHPTPPHPTGRRCVYYVGTKDERHRQYVQEVAPKNFNILVTTYEYIMRDRAKLSKIEWKYIIIDEAQRLKERQSKLSKDLDRFVGGRRLLLTGTPLQNELRELWNLLNLLLPEACHSKGRHMAAAAVAAAAAAAAFLARFLTTRSSSRAWFDEMLEQEGDDDDELSAAGAHEAKLLATEKKLVVVHRLHQILVPFMLRRQVQDVEGKLPPKVAVVVKVSHDALPERCVQLGQGHGAAQGVQPPAAQLPADPADGFELMRQCGKLVMLDRMLVKFCHTGHR
ncbi:hypothetical protein QJQ45_027848, partial [Haematococcus lacustris]